MAIKPLRMIEQTTGTTKRVTAKRFHALQALFWCANCTLSSYAVAYFMHQGISSVETSGIVAIGMISSFLAQLFWGKVCDNGHRNREVFTMNCALALILTAIICVGMQNKANWVALIYPVLVFLTGPLATNLDAWESKYLKDRGASLGMSRGCAAAAYASFHFFFAKAVEATEYRVIPWAAFVLYSLTILLALATPSVRVASEKVASEKQPRMLFKSDSLRSLIGNHSYLLLLLLLFFIGLGSSPVNSMKIVLYQNVGKDVSFLGVDSLLCSGFQIPLFFLGQKLRRFRAENRLLWSTAILTVAMLIIAGAESAATVLLGHVLLSSAYPVLLIAMRNIVSDTVDLKLQTTANGLCDAFYSSLSGIFAMSYTGVVLEQYGVKPLLGICLGFYFAAITVCLVRYVHGRRMQAKASHNDA